MTHVGYFSHIIELTLGETLTVAQSKRAKNRAYSAMTHVGR